MDEKLIAALVALGGVILATLINLSWNYRNAKDLRKQPFLEVQLDACVRVSRAASKFATSQDPVAKAAAAAEFWELYWGELAIVEDAAVESRVIRFGDLVDDIDQGKSVDPLLLKDASLDIAYAIRDLVPKSWDISMPELARAKATMSSGSGKELSGIDTTSLRNPD